MSETITQDRRMRLFIAKFEISDGCWEWQAGLTEGYGSFWIGRRTTGAHRVSYSTFVEPIPDGRQIHHLCANKACVRPDHLEVVTQAENMQKPDGAVATSWRKRARSRCTHGHEYTPDNTYISPTNGQRVCRACKNRRNREYRARKRAIEEGEG